MKSKTFLVAKREYVENVRTKAFWIGILSFPVIIALMVIVPLVFMKAKDLQAFAVQDRSGWLLGAVEERAAVRDTHRLLQAARALAEQGPSALAALPEPLAGLAPALGELTDEQMIATARALAAEGRSSIDVEVELAALPPELAQRVREASAAHRQWWKSLTAAEARKLAPGLSKGRWARVDAPAGTDAEAALREKLEKKELFAYFVIAEDPLAGSQDHKYVSNNRTDQDLRQWFSDLATDEVRARRFASEGVGVDVALRIQEPVSFAEKRVGAGGVEAEVGSSDRLRQWAPVACVYLLWICIFTTAQMLLTNTIEEKSNRVIEVLLSSVSPLQLMAGKILGIALTGLTVVGSWVVFVAAGAALISQLLPAGELDLASAIAQPAFLISFLVYFLLGYLLYAAVLVAIGAACNTLREAQNFMSPVMVVLILPMLAMMPIGQNPNGTLAKVLSFVPPFTPFVMMNRAAGPPEPWEYVATTVVLLASIAVAFWMAAKVFRVGILMTGKPPTPAEIIRWIRAPVGVVPDSTPRT